MHHTVHAVAPYLQGATVMWLISAAISTMPPLPSNAGYFAKWIWAFLHTAGANLDKVHIPGSAADIAAQPKDDSKS